MLVLVWGWWSRGFGKNRVRRVTAWQKLQQHTDWYDRSIHSANRATRLSSATIALWQPRTQRCGSYCARSFSPSIADSRKSTRDSAFLVLKLVTALTRAMSNSRTLSEHCV